jgi:crotonobetainyl-CoA:carnitine CoA-transferase CaiB-like acyl-CoA transferase
LRQRKKAREQVEALVKTAVAARTFDAVAARLNSAGVGFTEVLPLERVLDAPQARHPGKLRDVRFRGFEFSIPDFPFMHASEGGTSTQSPPGLGEHTAAVLKSVGVDQTEFQAMLATGAVAEETRNSFPWAAVRREA